MTVPCLRRTDSPDGINVIVADRWVALFPAASGAQVDFLIDRVNQLFRQQAAEGRSSASAPDA
jgi:hypothetical protein